MHLRSIHCVVLFAVFIAVTGCCGPAANRVNTGMGSSSPALPDGSASGSTAMPAGLPVDALQPWETLDESGKVISGINGDSEFLCGVERHLDSSTGVSDNGEAVCIDSGDCGSGTVSWAMYRLVMGGLQPGVISADVNPGAMSNGAQSEYYVGLSDYSRGCWEWHGPFTDNHVRISTGADVAAGSDYLSELGNNFVCVVAHDGAAVDVVGIGTNVFDAADTEAPPVPAWLIPIAVQGGVDLQWEDVLAGDLAGYRMYWSGQSFSAADEPGVQCVPYLIGQSRHLLAGLDGEVHVCVSAVDISGNESALSAAASTPVLAGAGPELRLDAGAASGLINDAITLTAAGAEAYDWDLDGDGVYEVTGDVTGTQSADTGRTGIIRPSVRGTAGEGTCVSCAAVSLVIAGNSRPVANAYATPTTGAAPLLVTLTGTGVDDDGQLASYSWDFDGDGVFDRTDDTDPGPVAHTYETAGLYNAKFRVEDNLGSWDIDTVSILVSPSPAPENQPPVADLAVGAGEETGDAPHSVHFDASGSSDPDSGDSIVRYNWDLDGDGAYELFTTSPLYNYTYTGPGIFNAAVMVEDSHGATGVDSVEITVSVAGNNQPVAALTVDQDRPLTGRMVTFDASGSTAGGDAGDSIVLYEWDFNGDGAWDAGGASATAAHAYTVQYGYDALVRVTDEAGAQDTAGVQVAATHTPWSGGGHDTLSSRRSPYTGAQTNNLKWSYTTGNDVQSCPAIGADGTVYVGSCDYKLYALKPDGTLKWSYTTGGYLGSSPAIGADGTVYVGSFDYKLYALNPDGTLRWSYTTGGIVYSSPVIGADGTVYVGSYDDKLYALNPDGTLRWSYLTGLWMYSSPAIGVDGTVYVGSDDNKLYAINPNGTLKWSYTTGNDVYSPAIGADGTVYVGSVDNKLYAINPNGTLKWSYTTGNDVESFPVIGADGTVYVGSNDSKLYALNPDGTLKWSYTAGSVVDSSPAIGADGTVYVGSWDNKLYAFGPTP